MSVPICRIQPHGLPTILCFQVKAKRNYANYLLPYKGTNWQVIFNLSMSFESWHRICHWVKLLKRCLISRITFKCSSQS